MNRIFAGIAICILFSNTTAKAQELATFRPEVAAAWQKAGAEICWLARTGNDGWHWTTAKPASKNAWSCMRFAPKKPMPDFGKLPVPDVPFALFVGQSDLNNADMKQIARFQTVVYLSISLSQVDDAGLQELIPLESLRCLDASGPKFTDKGAKYLAKLPLLEHLWLSKTNITDVGVKELARLKRLKFVSFAGTKITDKALQDIAKIDTLESLWLDRTLVTDRGLHELTRMESLKLITLHKTNVTQAGLSSLRKAMPHLRIPYFPK